MRGRREGKALFVVRCVGGSWSWVLGLGTERFVASEGSEVRCFAG